MRESSVRLRDIRLHLALLLLMMISSWALRLYQLDAKSIWSDEGLSIYRARQTVGFILTNKIPVQGVVTKDTQPPLYFVALHGLRAVAGESEFALRFLSVAFATLIIPSIYALGRHLISPRAGLFAALLSATSPTNLWYAQEIRMYSMLVFVSVLATYCLLKLLAESVGWRRSKVLWLLAYLVSMGATIYTHYSGFFLLAFHGAVVAIFILSSRRWRMAALMGLAALASIPLLPFVLRRLITGTERDFAFVPLNIILLDLLNGLSVGISVDLANTVVPILLGTLVFAFGVLALKSDGGWGRRGKAFFVLGYLLLPVLTLYAVSYVKPMYMGVRHLLIVSPAYYLGAAAALAYLSERRMGWASLIVAIALLGGNAYATRNYFLDPAYLKNDLRTMFRYIRDRYRPGDLVLLNDAVLEKALSYYAPGMPWTAQPVFGHLADEETLRETAALIDSPQSESDGFRRIWYVYGPPSTFYDPEQIVAAWLEEHLFKLDFRRFAGFSTEVGVYCYATHPPIAETDPEITASLAEWAGQATGTLPTLKLVDYELPQRATPSGETLPISLDWWLGEALDADYKISARLLGPDGSAWAQADNVAFYFFPMTAWPVGKTIEHVHELLIPPGTPPGTYNVELRAYHPETGTLLNIAVLQDGAGGGHTIGERIDLGKIEIGPAIRKATLRDLPPRRRVEAAYGQEITLAAYTWPDRTYQPGDVLHIDTYWRTTDAAGESYQLLMELVPAETDAEPPEALLVVSVTLAASGWPLGDLIRGQNNLVLPTEGLETGEYAVRASLFGAGTSEPLPVRQGWWPRKRNWLELGRLVVEVPPIVPRALPPIQHPMEARVSDAISFLGYDLPTDTVAAGQEMELNLYWYCEAPIEESYTVFTHIIDANSDIWGQKDGVPVGGSRPTSGWRVGETIVDSYRIPVKAEAAEGEYKLTIGMYDPNTSDRLTPVDQNGTPLPHQRITLQPVRITR